MGSFEEPVVVLRDLEHIMPSLAFPLFLNKHKSPGGRLILVSFVPTEPVDGMLFSQVQFWGWAKCGDGKTPGPVL